ncbi:MAG: LD-carboxypeptidase [Clostridiales bacterium]|nr:LD-carboxypeptidase [Clostridiales bacterium]
MILKKGSKVALISPSNGLSEMFPDVFESGVKNLETFFNYEVVICPSCTKSTEFLYNNPKFRAEEINNVFADTTIDGIICSIGGYESVRILDYLDIELILNNPKLIMGFSDSTSFLTYLNILGLKTYYGHSVMAGLAQLHHFPNSLDQVKKYLTTDWEEFEWTCSDEYVDGYKDWFVYPSEVLDPKANNQCYEVFSNKMMKGQLWGGCIEVLEGLKGTKYWPAPEFFDGKILFFETSEEKPTPDQVGYMIRNYATQGLLNRVEGIVFGRCKDYTNDEYNELKRIILNIFEIELEIAPKVIFNLDFGHTDPKWILPYGVDVEFNCESKTLVIKKD